MIYKKVSASIKIFDALRLEIVRCGGKAVSWEEFETMTVSELIILLGSNNVSAEFKYKKESDI